MFCLPARYPEHNPDKYLNNDIHHSVNAANLPTNSIELRSNIQKFLQCLAKLPNHVANYFKNPYISYAAATV